MPLFTDNPLEIEMRQPPEGWPPKMNADLSADHPCNGCHYSNGLGCTGGFCYKDFLKK